MKALAKKKQFIPYCLKCGSADVKYMLYGMVDPDCAAHAELFTRLAVRKGGEFITATVWRIL